MTERMDEVLIIGMKQQFFKLGSVTIKGANTDGSGKLWLGRMVTGIANLSFACELSLKHLYYQKYSRTIPGHGLLKLFNEQDSDIQKDIKAEYATLCESKLKELDCKASFHIGEMPKNHIQDPCYFNHELNKYSESFIEKRYYFEPNKTIAEGVNNQPTKYYRFDYRFLYLFFLAINSLVKDDNTYEEYFNYYENLNFDMLI